MLENIIYIQFQWGLHLFPFSPSVQKTNEWTTRPKSHAWWDLFQNLGFLHHFKSSDSWNCQRTEHLLRSCWRPLWLQIILPNFSTYNESSVDQTMKEKNTSRRESQMSSLNWLISQHQLQRKPKQSIAMFCTSIILVCVILSVLLDEDLLPSFQGLLICLGWFMVGLGLTAYWPNSSHILFSMQRKARQEVWRSRALCYIPRGSRHFIIWLIKRKASGATHTRDWLSPRSFLSFIFFLSWDDIFLLQFAPVLEQRDWTGSIHLLKDTNTAGFSKAKDIFRPTSWSFI